MSLCFILFLAAVFPTLLDGCAIQQRQEALAERNRIIQQCDAFTSMPEFEPLKGKVPLTTGDAEAVSMEATDRLTAAATVAARPSLAAFFKALFASIEENSVSNYGHIPVDFKPTDNTLALLANCSLNLGPDNLVSSEYVKRLRQRERGRG
jgi:hypothetical protein